MIAAPNITDPAMLYARLSSQQKRGIKLIAEHRLYRRRDGYGMTPYRVSLDIISALRALHLVRVDTAAHNPCPVLTGMGQMVHAVMQQRAERRRQA